MMMFSIWAGLATFSVLGLTFVVLSVIPQGLLNGLDNTSSNIWSDGDVDNLIRRLRRSTTDDESAVAARLQFVKLKYPWTVRRHFLPNYVLNGHRIRSKSNPTGDLTRDRYVGAVKVFVHVPRTSGTSLVECVGCRLRNIGGPLLMAPRTTPDYRSSSWDKADALGQTQRNRYDFHAGGDSFGVCDSVHQRPCSYFTVLRDPFEQVVSSYRHCRTSLGDPQCNVINANRVGLRDWIVLHGGHLFRKFLFDSRICDKSIEAIAGNVDDDLMHSAPASCWYKHKLWVETFPEDEKRILLDYILDNLERNFAVVGLYEDMESTLRTLEFVYGMPFSECPVPSDSKVRVNVNSDTDDVDIELEKEELRNDVDVLNALEYDERIYRRARDIVSQQNRLLFNRLKP